MRLRQDVALAKHPQTDAGLLEFPQRDLLLGDLIALSSSIVRFLVVAAADVPDFSTCAESSVAIGPRVCRNCTSRMIRQENSNRRSRKSYGFFGFQSGTSIDQCIPNAMPVGSWKLRAVGSWA